MTSRRNVVRFAVGSPNGPRSSVWRVWTGQDGSAYVSVRNIAGHFKASLHPARWRIAFADLSEAQRIAVGRTPTNRAIDLFPPSKELAPGIRRGFVIMVPTLGVRSPQGDDVTRGEIHWLAPPPADGVVEITLVLTTAQTAGWPGRRSMGTALVGRLPLPEDAVLWVVSRVVQPPGSVIDRWTEILGSIAQTAPAKANASSDLRGFLLGNMAADGCRFFVDVAIPLADPRRDP